MALYNTVYLVVCGVANTGESNSGLYEMCTNLTRQETRCIQCYCITRENRFVEESSSELGS